MAIKNVIIAGGGFGGVKAALLLAKSSKKINVKLISDNTHFEYHGALYRSATGHSPMEVVIPLKNIFEGYNNVELILDSVEKVDSKKKVIRTYTGESHSYDVSVFALGNKVDYRRIPGASSKTAVMHDIASTIKLRNQLMKLITSQKNQINISIIGAGPSGIELAGEIPEFVKLVARKHQIKPPKLKINLVDGAPRLLPNLSQKSSRKIKKRLHSIGTQIHLNTLVESCEKDKVCLSSGDLKADLIIWTAGSTPVDFYKNNPETFTLGRGGRVYVDSHLMASPDVFVIGDNADVKYSGMAQTALFHANYVARSIIKYDMRPNRPKYRPKKPLYVITAGSKWALVENGNSVRTGYGGWITRRRADLAIFRQFEPYEKAIKTWRQANRYSKSI